MKRFTDFLAESRAASVEAPKIEIAPEVSATKKLYLSLLEQYGVESAIDLDDEKFEEFHAKLAESLSAEVEQVLEGGEIKDEKSFREYATNMLKKAHGDDYDEGKAKETIDGIIGDVDGDWDKAVGKIQSSMG